MHERKNERMNESTNQRTEGNLRKMPDLGRTSQTKIGAPSSLQFES